MTTPATAAGGRVPVAEDASRGSGPRPVAPDYRRAFRKNSAPGTGL